MGAVTVTGHNSLRILNLKITFEVVSFLKQLKSRSEIILNETKNTIYISDIFKKLFHFFTFIKKISNLKLIIRQQSEMPL
jgi:hypothetical protein